MRVKMVLFQSLLNQKKQLLGRQECWLCFDERFQRAFPVKFKQILQHEFIANFN